MKKVVSTRSISPTKFELSASDKPVLTEIAAIIKALQQGPLSDIKAFGTNEVLRKEAAYLWLSYGELQKNLSPGFKASYGLLFNFGNDRNALAHTKNWTFLHFNPRSFFNYLSQECQTIAHDIEQLLKGAPVPLPQGALAYPPGELEEFSLRKRLAHMGTCWLSLLKTLNTLKQAQKNGVKDVPPTVLRALVFDILSIAEAQLEQVDGFQVDQFKALKEKYPLLQKTLDRVIKLRNDCIAHPEGVDHLSKHQAVLFEFLNHDVLADFHQDFLKDMEAEYKAGNLTDLDYFTLHPKAKEATYKTLLDKESTTKESLSTESKYPSSSSSRLKPEQSSHQKFQDAKAQGLFWDNIKNFKPENIPFLLVLIDYHAEAILNSTLVENVHSKEFSDSFVVLSGEQTWVYGTPPTQTNENTNTSSSKIASETKAESSIDTTDLKIMTHNHYSPLAYLARNPVSLDVLEALLQHKARPSRLNNGIAPIHELIMGMNPSDSKEVQAKKATALDLFIQYDPKALNVQTGTTQDTPITTAAQLGLSDVVKQLLRHGPHLDKVTANGDRLLHILAAFPQAQVGTMALAIQNGADAMAFNQEGYTPIQLLCVYVQKNTTVQKYAKGVQRTTPSIPTGQADVDELAQALPKLNAEGVTIAKKRTRNNQAIHMVTDCPPTHPSYPIQIKKLAVLCADPRTDLNPECKEAIWENNSTPLLKACYRGWVETAETLLNAAFKRHLQGNSKDLIAMLRSKNSTKMTVVQMLNYIVTYYSPLKGQGLDLGSQENYEKLLAKAQKIESILSDKQSGKKP